VPRPEPQAKGVVVSRGHALRASGRATRTRPLSAFLHCTANRTKAQHFGGLPIDRRPVGWGKLNSVPLASLVRVARTCSVRGAVILRFRKRFTRYTFAIHALANRALQGRPRPARSKSESRQCNICHPMLAQIQTLSINFDTAILNVY
jgi:hypothetical protein